MSTPYQDGFEAGIMRLMPWHPYLTRSKMEREFMAGFKKGRERREWLDSRGQKRIETVVFKNGPADWHWELLVEKCIYAQGWAESERKAYQACEDAIIRRQCAKDEEDQLRRGQLERALDMAEQCNAFTRAVLAYVVEPRGLRSTTINARKLKPRGKKLNAALGKAHCAWVDADCPNTIGWVTACIARAQAAYDLLIYVLGGWEIPDHISVPAALKR